jgi:ketosteroid isomerase-like protein
MLPPGMDIQKGRAAIEKTIAAIGGSGIRNFALTAIDVSQVGPDTAREIGRFSLEAPAPKKKWVKVNGKYVVVWKQVAGKWLLDQGNRTSKSGQ